MKELLSLCPEKLHDVIWRKISVFLEFLLILVFISIVRNFKIQHYLAAIWRWNWANLQSFAKQELLKSKGGDKIKPGKKIKSVK